MNYYMYNLCHPIYLTHNHPHINAIVKVVNDSDQAWDILIDHVNLHHEYGSSGDIRLEKGETYTYTVPYDVVKMYVEADHPRILDAKCSLRIVPGQTVTLREIWQRGDCRAELHM